VTLFCSFCGSSQHEVEHLIAGPSIAICNRCVARGIATLSGSPDLMPYGLPLAGREDGSCAFCGNSGATKLLTSDDRRYICRECLLLCHETLTQPTTQPRSAKHAEAVFVDLDCTGVGDQAARQHEVRRLERQLLAAIERNGLEFHLTAVIEPDKVGDLPTRVGGAWLQLDTPNAERLFAVIEATLRANPLCKGAQVIVRNGGPGSPQHEVLL
jgi:ClpX C4-type zinc finger